jgi:hypothetical protein
VEIYYEDIEEKNQGNQDEELDDKMKKEVIKESQMQFVGRAEEADPSISEEEPWMGRAGSNQGALSTSPNDDAQVAHHVVPTEVHGDPQASNTVVQDGFQVAQGGPGETQGGPQAASFAAESRPRAALSAAEGHPTVTTPAPTVADSGSRAVQSAADGRPGEVPDRARATGGPIVNLSATGMERKAMNEAERVEENEGRHFKRNSGASVQPLMASILLCLVLNRLL